MLSNNMLDTIIAAKRREIEEEKIELGLSPQSDKPEPKNATKTKQVSFTNRILTENNAASTQNEKEDTQSSPGKRDSSFDSQDENIPPDLERYIRRYLGLPTMLKAGEFSPNNPWMRGERATGDVLLGLGEYERRRLHTRRARQAQYKEYLDQQAKKKQEEKERLERERREREEKDRIQEERERERQLERERQIERDRLMGRDLRFQRDRDFNRGGERDRNFSRVGAEGDRDINGGLERDREINRVVERDREISRVGIERDREISRVGMERDRAINRLGMERDREINRAGIERDRDSNLETEKADRWERRGEGDRRSKDTAVQASVSEARSIAVQTDDMELFPISSPPGKLTCAERELSPRAARPREFRRASYGDYDERPLVRRGPREREESPARAASILDADAITLRNQRAEQEAAVRRQFYQQELKNQIQEQQRIREERKSREKMLEQAEMRRMEEQLRMLQLAQEREGGRQHDILCAMKENATDYEKKRTALQKELDDEHKAFRTLRSRPPRTLTPQNDQPLSKLPFYYPRILERKTDEAFARKQEKEKPPFSMNIPENSIFSPHYDVDGYLRKNLNPTKESLYSRLENISSRGSEEGVKDREKDAKSVVVEALVHESPKKKHFLPSMRSDNNIDSLPIPVLRHTPKSDVSLSEVNELSDAMRIVDDKWKVPAVQRNLLKSVPNNEGKNVSILTQLGSIRRQLQLEQLKLDNLLGESPKDV